MLTIKKLNSSDADALVALVKSRPQTFIGYNDNSFSESIIIHSQLWLSDPMCFCLGLYDDNEMILAIVTIESPHSPSWTWAYWIAKSDWMRGLRGYGENQSLRMIWQEIDTLLFDEMETKRGLNRFYFAYRDNDSTNSLRSARSGDRWFTYLKKNFKYISRYAVCDDAVITADSMPKYDYQKKILGNRTWPFDLIIKCCVLVN
jgi:hypothetical protein